MSDIIKQFYAFKEKIPPLLNHLAKTDFFTVISEEDLAAKLNYELQSVIEDPCLNIKTMHESSDKGQELDTTPKIPSSSDNLIDSLFKLDIVSGNNGYLRFERFPSPTILIGI